MARPACRSGRRLLQAVLVLVFGLPALAVPGPAPDGNGRWTVLSGSLAAPEGRAVERLSVEARFRPDTAGAPPKTARLDCSVSGGRFTCPLPVSSLDARLLSPGFAPFYIWDLKTEGSGPEDLGRVPLHPGASVSGWVAAAEHGASLAEVSVELKPERIGWQGNPAERKRVELRDHQARAGQNGFFQLTGIGPGAYVLTARRKGFSPAVLSLEVPEGGEVALREPLLLEPLARLQVWLTPASSLEGLPWQVQLLAKFERSNVYETVARSAAALDGSWSSPPLEHGAYEIAVLDAAGSVLHRSPHQIDSATPALFLELDLVPVRGTLSMGGEPLSAGVVFGTTNRVPNVRMDADEEGRFEGYLPRAGTWPVEILMAGDRKQRAADVEVERRASGKPDELEIELPETRIAGQVTAGGKPVGDAFVVIMRRPADGRPQREAALRVDREGRFEALGLSPGSLSVRAYDRERTSAWMALDLAEDVKIPDLRLELGETVEVQGRLLSPHGPVAGGLIAAWAELPDTRPLWLGENVSGADGTFRLTADARAAALKIVSVVPGCGVDIGRFPVPREPATALTLMCAPGKGEIRMPAARPDGLLLFHGVPVEVSTLFQLLEPAGFLGWSQEGPVLRGMPEGAYRYCVTGSCEDLVLLPGAASAISPVSPGGPE